MPATPAIAQILQPKPIDAPVMEKWRAPIEDFLHGFGLGEPLLPFTRMGPIDDRHFVVRVDHQSTCMRDACLTAIGLMQDAKFQAKVMFFAGKMITQGDTFPRGALRPAVMFYRSQAITADSDSVFVIETQNGWVVVPLSK